MQNLTLLVDGCLSNVWVRFGNTLWMYRRDMLLRFQACRLILQIGFNKGDGVLGYQHPYSMTPAVLNMSTDTNVGDTGRWMYSVHGNPTGCDRTISGKSSVAVLSFSIHRGGSKLFATDANRYSAINVKKLAV